MDEFTLDDCKLFFYGASPSSSASADDFSSIFHQVDTHPSADHDVSSMFHPNTSAPCLGFEEWMNLQAEEAADTFLDIPLSHICDDLFEDKLQLQLNGTLESALLGHDLPQPIASHAALQYSPQVAAAINAASGSNITSDPQEVASSSTSITNANLLDLKNIIVKKPILDKAVETLGGGMNGTQRLWGLIQVWLKHQNLSPSLEIPFLSNSATNQAAPPPTSLEKLLLHESNVHIKNATFFNVIGPAMDVLPTSAPIIIPGESVVLGTTATALVACESPTVSSRARSRATAATLRAARKHRMACKRKYLSHHQSRPASELSLSTLQATGPCHDSYQPDAYFFSHDWKVLESRMFLFKNTGILKPQNHLLKVQPSASPVK